MPGTRLEENVQHLLEAVNGAAKHVQNVHLTFLLLSTYIAIIVGSTRDEQLLTVSSATLPLLNVNLPIVAFYTFIPWLFLLLHFNLLLQLYLLACKLHQFEAAVIRSERVIWEEQAAKMFPFPFSHMLIGHYRGLVQFLLTGMVLITVLLLPLVILAWMQVRFLPYHDAGITWTQRAAVWTDLILLLVFWPQIIVPARRRSQAKAHDKSQNDDRKKAWTRYWQRMQTGWRWPNTRRDFWSVSLIFITLMFFFFSLAVAVLPGEDKGWLFGYLTDQLFDAPDAYFHRNLRLAGKTLVGGELSVEIAAGLRSQDPQARKDSMKHVVGLNLTNRDIRFADLRDALLPKADLRGANLDNARLDQADLSGADLRPFDINEGGHCIQKAQEESLTPEEQHHARLINLNLITEGSAKKGRFCSTSLRGARLSAVSLESVQLPYAQLQGAILVSAELSKTNLWRARLQSANMRNARIREADLRYAQLQGASLGKAQLQGANLSNAYLQGVTSMDVELQGAFLEDTQLQGATLLQARLQGASLQRASLQGTRLETAQLQGADLRGAHLHGADLTQAQLRGADLAWTAIGGANFRLADLSLSDLREVHREPLTQEAYSQLAKTFKEAVSDKQRWDSGLKRLRMSVGQPDTLHTARRAEDVLCGDPTPFKHCISSKEIERYDRKLVVFLATLACGDSYVAWNIGYRTVMPGYETQRSLRPELARRLLDSNCEGTKALPEDAKKQLRQVAETSEGRKVHQP